MLHLLRATERHHARLALQHAGAFDAQVSAMMCYRVLGRSGTAARYRGSWPAWLDASCRLSRSRIGAGLHVDSAMRAHLDVGDALLLPGRMEMRIEGQPAWIPAYHRRLHAYHAQVSAHFGSECSLGGAGRRGCVRVLAVPSPSPKAILKSYPQRATMPHERTN